jgi:hypothetical protein
LVAFMLTFRGLAKTGEASVMNVTTEVAIFTVL